MPAQLDVQEILRTARSRLRRRTFRRQALRFTTWTIGLVGTAAILDHLYRFVDWQRWIACGAIVAAVSAVHWFGLDRRRQGRKLSDLFVARELEKANPALHNTLVTALQANRPISLSERMQRELDTAVRTIGQAKTPSNYRWALPAILLLICVYAFTAPQSVWQSSSRVLTPWRAIPPPTYTVIVSASLSDGDYVVTENPWRFDVTAAGYTPESGELHARRGGGPWQKLPLAKSPSANQYAATLPPVSGNWTLRARLGDAYLSQRTINVLQRPATLAVRQELFYPDYLDQPDTQLKQWPIQAVVGTRVNLEIQLDRNVDAAKLVWCGTSIALRPVGRLLRTNTPIPIEHSGNWRVYYRLAEADDWIRGDGAQVTAVPDLLPEAKILQPQHDVEVNADSLVEFQYEATDDFIVKSPEIIVRSFGSEEKVEIALPQPVLPDRLAGSWTFLPQEFDAKPGDRLTVAMRVRDGHPGHLPGWSKPIGITVTAPVAPLLANNQIELTEAQQPELQSPPRRNPKADGGQDTDNKSDETTPPQKPLTEEQLADAKTTTAQPDPKEQPDAVVKIDKIPDDPEGKQQPITKTNTEPAAEDGDKPTPDQQPQNAQAQEENGDGKPETKQQASDTSQEQNTEQAEKNDKQQQPSEQGGKQGHQTAASDPNASKPEKPPEQKPGDKPGEKQQAANAAQKCEECGEKTAGSKQCDRCAGGQKPGSKPGSGQQQTAQDGNEQKPPGDQPGKDGPASENSANNDPKGKQSTPDRAVDGDAKADQQTADNKPPGQDPSDQPGATNVPDGKPGKQGAELAGDETGDGDPASESTLPNDNAPLPDFQETEAPTAADLAAPFQPNQTTEEKADLATNQAPIPSDAPTPIPEQDEPENDETLQPTELETFERLALNTDKRFEEANRKPGAPNPKPGFAPPQYNADDVDLIQSFREAANRLLRQKKKQ